MNSKKRLVLAVILLSYVVTTMDGAVVITGLEKIAEDLDLGQSALSWVQNAYMLAWGGFMLMGGKLSDVYGRRSILILSLCLFGISSLFAGISSSAGVLIGARFVQGTGAAVLAPTCLALIIDCFDGMERVKAIAWYSSISGLGLSIGLVTGGVMAGLFSWRYGFFINIPIIIIMLAISVTVLDRKTEVNKDNISFDLSGTALSVIGVFMFVYAINGASGTLPWLVAAFAVIFAFIMREKRATAPIMPLGIFNISRSRANFSRMLFSGSMTGFYFFISEYMQEDLCLSPLWIGVAFLPLTLSTFATAVKVPGAVRKYGNMRVLFFGQTMMLAGFAWMTLLGHNSNYWLNLALPMIVLGIGQGFTMSPLTNLGMSGVKPEDNGSASGVVNAAHQIGCSAGLSVMVAASSDVTGIVPSCHIAMLSALLFTVISFVTLFWPKNRVTANI